MKRLRLLAFALLLASGSLVAHADSHQDGQHGGTLTIAIPQDVVTFDAQVTTAPPNAVRAKVVETLLSLDEDWAPQPLLAESWEVSDDELTWIFHLREGVEFHDGTPLTADDVVASFDRYMRAGVRAWEFERVESWEAADETSVRFHLSAPWAAFTEALAAPFGGFAIYPEWVVEEWGDDMGSDNFIGTGPYRVEEFVPEEIYRLVRYENYVGSEEPSSFMAGKRHAYADEIVLLPIPDDSTRTSALLTGEVDMAFQIPTDEFNRLDQDANVNVAFADPGLRVYLKMNASEGPFADHTLRRAVQTAIDLEEVMFTQGPPELWRVNPTPRFQEGQWMHVDNMHEFHANDLERGRELVEESDYDGETIVLMGSPGRVVEFRIIPIVEQILRDLGLNVETVTYDAATFSEVRQDLSAWHIKQAGGGSAVPVSYLGSGARDRTGQLWEGFPIDEWNQYEEITQTEMDLDVRREAIAELNRIYGEFANEIWIGDVFTLTGCRTHVGYCAPYFKGWFTNVWLEQ